MPTATMRSLKIKSSLHCFKIYPGEQTKRTIEELKTVALRLTKSQAVDLATALLAAAQHWEIIDITGFRRPSQGQSTGYPITVTSKQKQDLFQDELHLG